MMCAMKTCLTPVEGPFALICADHRAARQAECASERQRDGYVYRQCRYCPPDSDCDHCHWCGAEHPTPEAG